MDNATRGSSLKVGGSITGDDATTPTVQDFTQANKEPPQGRTPASGEDTPAPQINEREDTQSDQTATAVLEEKVSEPGGFSGAKAREIGETRKTLATGYIELAEQSEENRTWVKAQLEKDPRLQKYFQSKFGDQYNYIMLGDRKPAEKFDKNNFEARERLRIRADFIAEQENNLRMSDAENIGMRLGLSRPEVDSLYELANQLEGRNIGGKELTYQDALKRAALSIRPDKANKATFLSGNTVTTRPKQEEIEDVGIDDGTLDRYAKTRGRQTDELKASLKNVNRKLRSKDNVYHLG